MKELFTKHFWKDVKQTYEEAQQEPAVTPKPAEVPPPDDAVPPGETATS
jgi:hypothetical protein